MKIRYFWLFIILSSTHVFAREPGISNSYMPGITIGTPVAAPLPPGLYFNNDANFYDARVTYPKSSSTAGTPSSQALSTAPKFIWSAPATTIPRFQMWIAQPVVYVHRYIPAANKSGSRLSIANTVILPMILSWQLAPAFFISSMLSINVPDGQYNKDSFVNVGYPFWTISPEMGVSYVNDRANLTLHLIYSFNSTNNETGYHSASQIFADITALKRWCNQEGGLVGYYDMQIGGDRNSERFYKSLQRSKPLQFALGGFYGFTFKKVTFQFYATYDVIARDGALKGYRIFSRIKLPFF